MSYELFIAERYLRSKRHTRFISLITYISAGGVMIGVAALVIVLSVMNGFESEVRDRIIGADAHIKVTSFHEEPLLDYPAVIDQLRPLDHVTGVSPYIQGKGMLRRSRSVEGVIIKGVDEETVGQVSDLPQTIVAGELRLKTGVGANSAFLLNNDKPRRDDPAVTAPVRRLPGIILGRQIAFRIAAAVGDSLILISPAGMTGLFSTPSLKRFIVTGVFETGIFEYDDAFVYISLGSAQELFELGEAVTGVELKLENLDRADRVRASIEERLGYPYYARTWHDMHRTLFRWMKIEKWLYLILLSLIIMVAAFNIVSSQIMMVLEKRRDIGILKAMGAPRDGIMRIFMLEGLIVGVIGTAFGLVIGWVLCWAQQTYRFFSLPGDVYFLDALPVRMQPLDFVIVALVAMGLTLLATVYPARRAAKLDPVDAIRYE